MSKSIFNLEGKVVLITGAAGIQGPEHVKAFTAAGAKVIATDIKELDVTSTDSINQAVKKIIGEYGRIDVLVNNAGATGKYAADWDQIIKVNLTGTYLCCQIIGAAMKQGSIINVSSIYGLVGPDLSMYEQAEYAGKPMGVPAGYAASKGGVIALTKYFASLYAPKIRVNCVTPGGIFDNQDENFVKKYSSKTMLGRMAKRNEVSGALLYLASDLSSYVTGANLAIDGGLTARA
ncbi:short-chain dehydrogenase [Candidatus Beckwithbacteria bacterium CG22_combo_CG10-13_8_21_14_all_01_47_9]|uniref:Short-chain dehydrogenase n=1 Tax=Candidatus Beckwithbacteria bacterium CG22_combo_CG10-13_8_21_14_all_01_47_9 TaxID=1974496 RepID=A0A2H0E0G7_9BACT|nr:MAG: short-chain dehydrogenase [Candidatus Beckwithbacteria bacterium CG22_combo_CG10-13_8_21_14_all_01_47_9]